MSARPENWHYSWDADDRLVGIVTPDGARWRYRYDAIGRRTAKQRLGPDGRVLEQTDFTWDGVILAEQTHDGAMTTTWNYRPDSVYPITQVERRPRSAPQDWVDERFYSIVTDLVGSPTELVDPAGEIAWRAHATLWGAAVDGPTAVAATPLRFPGQYHDPESGFNYNYHRHYDPTAGRYVSSDPLGLVPGPNPYAYVTNPARQFDPLGLSCEDAADGGDDSQRRTLYHYTDEAGQKGILDSQQLNPSLREVNPRDARYGDGQYLSDIEPGTRSSSQLSRHFIGQPFQGSRFTHYVEVDVSGLNVVEGRPGVFVVPGNTPLDLSGRIVSWGEN